MPLSVHIGDLRRIHDVRIGRVLVQKRLVGTNAKFDAVLGRRLVKWRFDGVTMTAAVHLRGGDQGLAFLAEAPYIVGHGGAHVEQSEPRPPDQKDNGIRPASTDDWINPADLYPGWISLF